MPDVTVRVPTLRKGPNADADGMSVFRLQQILVTVGAGSLEEDGEFGVETERAVKVVQKKLNLTVDGVVGKNTWAALLKTYFAGSLPG
jgi:N-acetylmuramoyl-L-alanine amidase